MSAFMHDFSVNVYTQELHLTFIFSTIKKIDFNSFKYLVGATMPIRKYPEEASESTRAKHKPQSETIDYQ